MECHLFRMLIQRYHDGELDFVERAEYENHLRLCGPCRQLDREFARIFQALGEAPLYQPSRQFNAKVLSQVDISRYRVTAVRKAYNTANAAWAKVPHSARRVLAAAAVFILSVTVYRPFLDFLVSIGSKGLAYFGSGLLILRETILRFGTVAKYFSSGTNYRVAGETLLRAVQRVVAVIPAPYLGIAGLAVLVVLILVVRSARDAWKKGETHVGIF